MVDWTIAPEGATHYGPKTKGYHASWYKKVDGIWHFKKDSIGSGWHPMQNPPSIYRFGKMEKRQ
ncbi:hypothetical protein D3C85_735750 [compost metagenome]